MNKLFFCLIFATFLAFGQRVEKLDRATATRAWDMAMSLPGDTPQISKGGLIVEKEVNGIGRKVWLVATQPGTYLLQGRDCGGEEVKLGELGWWDTNSFAPVFSMQVVDTVGLQMATPFTPQICDLNVLRINDGRIEKSSTKVSPWTEEPSGLRVGGEGVTPAGQYYLAVGVIPTESVAILGRNLIASEIRNSPMGTSIIYFPSDGFLPAGPTTLTVCSKGVCSSVIFERRVVSTSTPEKG